MNYKIQDEINKLEVEIDKYQTYYYAGASLDFNPIHLDDEFAKGVGLPGKILQGLCTMAYVSRAVLQESDPSLLKRLKVRFRSPVKPLDKITITGKVTNLENNLITIDLMVINQKGEQVITNAQAIVINN